MRDGLISAEKAEREYGVLIGDAAGTERLRDRMRADRGEPADFDFGLPIDEILARAKEETGLDPPVRPEPLRWAAVDGRRHGGPAG